MSKPRGSNPSLEAQTLASRLKSQPRRSTFSLAGKISAPGSNLNCLDQIHASMFKFQSARRCQPSIGRQPLQGSHYHILTFSKLKATGTADHLTLLRLLVFLLVCLFIHQLVGCFVHLRVGFILSADACDVSLLTLF